MKRKLRIVSICLWKKISLKIEINERPTDAEERKLSEHKFVT